MVSPYFAWRQTLLTLLLHLYSDTCSMVWQFSIMLLYRNEMNQSMKWYSFFPLGLMRVWGYDTMISPMHDMIEYGDIWMVIWYLFDVVVVVVVCFSFFHAYIIYIVAVFPFIFFQVFYCSWCVCVRFVVFGLYMDIVDTILL